MLPKKLFILTALLTFVALLMGACGGAPAADTPATAAPAEEQAAEPAEEEAAEPTEAPAEEEAEVAEAEQVEVRWFVGLGTGTDPGQVEVENKVVEAFNASHPNIKLVLEVVAYEAARDTLATEISSGNPPDIVGPVGVSGAEAFHGQWLDLSPLIDAAGYDLNQYDEGAVDFYKVGGEGQVGIPFAIFPSALFYQRDLFDEAGLAYPPHKYGEKYKWSDGTEVEWNYDTLRELALLLTVDQEGKDATDPAFDPENIVQFGYHPQWQDLRAIGSYFGAGSLVTEDGKTAEVPAEWVDAWKWYYDGMWKDHFIASGPVAASEEFGADNVFNSGRAAMALTHLWYTCCLTDAGENWDVAVVPSHNGKTTANFNADTFRILKDSKNPEAAFEVLTYLLGDASLELLNAYGGMPARTADQKTFFDQQAKDFPQDVDWQVFIDGIEYADNPSFEGYMPNYNEAFDYSGTFLSKLSTTEDLDVEAEVDTFEKEIQAIFDKKP